MSEILFVCLYRKWISYETIRRKVCACSSSGFLKPPCSICSSSRGCEGTLRRRCSITKLLKGLTRAAITRPFCVIPKCSEGKLKRLVSCLPHDSNNQLQKAKSVFPDFYKYRISHRNFLYYSQVTN